MNDQISSVPLPDSGSWKFIEELKQPEVYHFGYTRTCAKSGEADLGRGVCIKRTFPETKGRLETAYADLEAFLRSAGIPEGETFSIITEQGESGPYDSFRLVVTGNSCRIIAREQEGIRRGIFYLEELLLCSDGPFLPVGEIKKNAWLKNRISRCFFGPVKRPPMNRDELMDEVDYYPEAYLNRLAHQGVNVLWLTVEFKDLCRTEFTPDAAPDREKRLAKLKRTAEKCLRYGIRTFLFMIEPILWSGKEEVLKKFPVLAGARVHGGRCCFCPSSETAYKYLSQSTYSIFSAVPELGGIINISLGERITTCLSSIRQVDHSPETDPECPRCGKIPKAEILYNSVKAMTDGMTKASPDAEFISWYYMPYAQEQEPWTFRLNHVPEHASVMYNFESGGREIQLGKERIGGDYWLSYTGPSDNFRKMAEEAKKAGFAIGAKIQTACSHELATVPDIPVPGQLYRKYKAMKELGVVNVMQCWYFGNYPGLMNRAAGMLAFEEFDTDETEFLNRLALPDWKSRSSEMAEIWKMTSNAYRNYPFANTVQYYGPYHSGVVWPLYPYEQHLPLAPTWLLNYPVSGDTIGEMLDCHTLAEATELAEVLADEWHKAWEKAQNLRNAVSGNPERTKDLVLMEALDLQFTSAWHILRFYLLRSEGKGFTEEMRSVMKEEIAVSEQMTELCRKDSRLGFHSEAENYEYFPEKLAARIAVLKEYMTNPPPEVKLPEAALNTVYDSKSFSWSIAVADNLVKIHADMHGFAKDDQIFVTLLGCAESKPLLLDLNHNGTCLPNFGTGKWNITEKKDGWAADFMVPFSDLHSRDGSFAVSLIRYIRGDCPELVDCYPADENRVRWRLHLGMYRPYAMVRIKPE